MDISTFGLAAIRRREGCKLAVYMDTQGHPTIGVGHLLKGPFEPGLTWTMEQAMLHLQDDLGVAIKAVNDAVKEPLTQPQFDAVVSLVFNIGVEAFCGSTILEVLNAGKHENAGGLFMMWTKNPELKGRRQDEMSCFMYGTV